MKAVRLFNVSTLDHRKMGKSGGKGRVNGPFSERLLALQCAEECAESQRIFQNFLIRFKSVVCSFSSFM
jgi:hypothetical protein